MKGETLDTLDFTFEITDDYKRARLLEDRMRAIEEQLRDTDDKDLRLALIDDYVQLWGNHNDLTGRFDVVDHGLNATYLPSQETVDLVTAAGSES